MNTQDLQKLKDALEIGRDAAHEVAQRFHEEMKGYREAEHKQVDKDVADIEEAIALAERTSSAGSAVVMSDEKRQQLEEAIKKTEYKYFGDYELSTIQRTAVEVLVEAAREQLAAVPAVAQEPKLTVRDGMWWPDGFCRDPKGEIIAPAGQNSAFRFGYDNGYADCMVELPKIIAASPVAAKPVPVDESDIRGPLTASQRQHARMLYNNLRGVQDGIEEVIRYVSTSAYCNGGKDLKVDTTPQAPAQPAPVADSLAVEMAKGYQCVPKVLTREMRSLMVKMRNSRNHDVDDMWSEALAAAPVTSQAGNPDKDHG